MLDLANFTPILKHDFYAIETIKEAKKAVALGNFGIGAILVNRENGEIAFRAHNKVFSSNRSDLHAEMDLLNQFESQYKELSREKIKDMILFTSLESCPMCLCRLIISGVKEVYHITDDNNGGMVHLYNYLPTDWKEISKNGKYEKAVCSNELSELAFQIFLSTEKLNDKLQI